MKNIINTIGLFIIIMTCLTSCDEENEHVPVDVSSGWIQIPDSSPANIRIVQGTETEITVGVNIQVPSTDRDLTIGYRLVPVSGSDPNTIFSNNGSIVAPAGLTSWSGPDNNTGIDYKYLGPITFNLNELPALTENMVFDVLLTSTDSDKISVGIPGEQSRLTQRVTICFQNIPLSYTGDAFIPEIDIMPGTLPPYQVTLTSVDCGVWSLDTTWGQDFVSILTAGQVPPGSFPYPSILTLNSDTNTVTITSSEGYATGGSGIYDPATGDISLRLRQALFQTPFVVFVNLTAN